jgi:DNA-binding Xre family transcriptional regulator
MNGKDLLLQYTTLASLFKKQRKQYRKGELTEAEYHKIKDKFESIQTTVILELCAMTDLRFRT